MSKLYTEHGHFVEIAGDYFCLKESCDGCPYKDKCENEVEETYTDFTPPVRYVIRTDNKTQPYSPYPKGINDKKDSVNRFQGKVLPQSNKKVYKRILEHPDIDGTDFIIYQHTSDKYYCLNQQCKQCKFNKVCKRELEIVEDTHSLLVIDFKNQEPRAFTLTCLTTGNREWNWDDVFRNDSIREQGQIYKTLENLFKHFKIDTSVKNLKFNEWVDNRFFKDRTELYRLQKAVFDYYKGWSEDKLTELQKVANAIIKDYEDYQIQLPANKKG